MSLILSLDLGTTGNRAVVYDSGLGIVASAYCEFPQYFPQPGWVEHDAIEILESVKYVVSEVLKSVSASEIVAVGVTNQRETVVAWDARTGYPICPAIVWQCRRTATYCQGLSKQSGWIKQVTGLPLDPYFSASKMRWILDHVSQAKVLAEEGWLRFGTIDTWILWQLTAGQTYATDLSNASRTMLVDLKTGKYEPRLLELFGISKSCLPTIYESDALFGMVAPTWGFSAPIRAVLGDQQSALFAQCGTRVGEIKTTYGTGLFCVTPTEMPVLTDELVTTVALYRSGKIRYALEGSIFTGGSLIQWLRDQCGWIGSSAQSEQMAFSVLDSAGVVVVPAFTGLGAPYWVPEAKGAILGVTRGTKPAHIVRAALEAIAFQVADVVDSFKRALPDVSFTRMGVDGGASLNSFLMQFQASLLRLSLYRPQNTESTSLGVAILAGLAVELIHEESVPLLSSRATVFSPQVEWDRGDALFLNYRRAVSQVIGFSYER